MIQFYTFVLLAFKYWLSFFSFEIERKKNYVYESDNILDDQLKYYFCHIILLIKKSKHCTPQTLITFHIVSKVIYSFSQQWCRVSSAQEGPSY